MTITVEAIRQPVGHRVRDMASNDIARLVELDALLFGADAWSETAWWAELAERPRRDYVVIVREATILAYGGLDIGTDSADVMTLAVAPEAQGQGLGRVLLAELEARAVARGMGAGLLEVRADNLAARALYEGAGWRQLHVRRRYYQPGDVDALILGKTFTVTEEAIDS